VGNEVHGYCELNSLYILCTVLILTNPTERCIEQVNITLHKWPTLASSLQVDEHEIQWWHVKHVVELDERIKKVELMC